MKQASNNQVTQILADGNNSQASLNRVFEIMYPEIKKLANAQLFKLNAGQTITPTVLVNECYIKLSTPSELSFENRQHFIFTVARCMRQFLVDRIKNNFRKKRAGKYSHKPITSIVGDKDINIELLDLDIIITKLEKINPNLAKLVIFRFFSGYSIIEIAEIKGVSKSTIIRQWNMAKSYITLFKNEL
jgi:RNA polymerase sigma factor (TIGR02999 family)